jgi:very-short-patch-repair endonuclease
LRALSPEGSHFRRQVPIGPYVVDFACLARRLIIELDGSGHAFATTAARDRTRQDWLEAEGYRVLRVWNPDLGENLDGVMETIRAALYGAPTAEAVRLVHKRRPRGPSVTPSRRASRADPPPPGEDKEDVRSSGTRKAGSRESRNG